MKTRDEALRALAVESYDVCVIGAGATGAGCALDAQTRGMRTALVDAGDFASCTSSASTKLAHGGVRYLEQAFKEFNPGQLKLIREALRERKRMLQNAPHLARTCRFLVPCFTWFERLYFGLGLTLYDWLAGSMRLGKSTVLSRSEAFALLPTLARQGVRGGVSYEDGQFDDARYCVCLVKTFGDSGGVAVNHVEVLGFERNASGRLSAATVKNVLTGKTFAVQAKIFVNATGPYSDAVRTWANPELSARLVLSKGVHLLLPLAGDLTTALLIPKTEDGRVLFAIPWLGRLLVGTTDVEITAGEDISVTRDEVEYLLRHLNRYSSVQYTANDVVSVFSGMRPLVRARGSRETKKLVRAHEVEVDRTSGLISVLGGKWTTYRTMAEDAIDSVSQVLEIPIPSKTRDLRLAGAEGYTKDHWQLLAGVYGVNEVTARHLAEKFGTEAEAVLSLTIHNPDLKAPLVESAPPIQAEVVYCARTEMAATIEDVLARRLGLHAFGWELAIRAAPVVAELLARELQWSVDQKTLAIEGYVGKIERQRRALAIPARA
jgi:glycerol-3-phosphate dehydrogenase